MAYVARASRTLPVPALVAFNRLADHNSWPAWMPKSFRPVETVGKLKEGSLFRVEILGLPMPIVCRVEVVRSPEELTWCGGTKGMLWAEHRFLFVPQGKSSVEVQSVETWSGPLASLLRRAIEPAAVRIGNEQLEGLAKAVAS